MTSERVSLCPASRGGPGSSLLRPCLTWARASRPSCVSGQSLLRRTGPEDSNLHRRGQQPGTRRAPPEGPRQLRGQVEREHVGRVWAAGSRGLFRAPGYHLGRRGQGALSHPMGDVPEPREGSTASANPPDPSHSPPHRPLPRSPPHPHPSPADPPRKLCAFTDRP